MDRTLDMQFIRYINLFGRISHVRAKHCFSYNNMILFVVPRFDVQKAIGQNNSNLQRLSQILRKRIRIVSQPKSSSQQDIEFFIKTIIFPVEYSRFQLNDNEVTLTADREGKARLIGRQRIREKELKNILDQYFGIKKLIIA